MLRYSKIHMQRLGDRPVSRDDTKKQKFTPNLVQTLRPVSGVDAKNEITPLWLKFQFAREYQPQYSRPLKRLSVRVLPQLYIRNHNHVNNKTRGCNFHIYGGERVHYLLLREIAHEHEYLLSSNTTQTVQKIDNVRGNSPPPSTSSRRRNFHFLLPLLQGAYAGMRVIVHWSRI